MQNSIYQFKLRNINGKEVTLGDSPFKGKTLLIVNTASKCGFTPQYKDLQAIHERYANEGFLVLGFPSNDFGAQEPGTELEIKEFCELNYGVNFPLFQKGPVKGSSKQELFKFLTESANPELVGEIMWNFEKFLIGKDGKLLARFSSKVSPSDKQITNAIESALKG